MPGFATLLSYRGWLGALAVSLLLPVAASAAPTITLGNYQLQAFNGVPQTISIFASGPATVGGIDLAITTGDGGPSNNKGGWILAPKITNVDLYQPGSVFVNDSNNDGTQVAADGQIYIDSTTSTSNSNNGVNRTIGTNQLLAVVTIDTTGFDHFGATYNISVAGTVNNGSQIITQQTDFPPPGGSQTVRNSDFVDGTITIIPEPASLGLLGLAVPALLLRRRRVAAV